MPSGSRNPSGMSGWGIHSKWTEPSIFSRGSYHLFEGDGMLHSLRISKGKATFCSRYVKTYKYMTERKARSLIIPNFFSSFNRGLIACAFRLTLAAARILTGQFGIANGIGTANISVSLIGGKLFALSESDLPYQIKIEPNGDVITLRRHTFGGKLNISMNPHPKVDPETKDGFAFRLGFIMPPFLTFFRINPDGSKGADVPIFSLKTPSYIHDFAITKNYVLFPDIQIGANVFRIRSPMGSDPRKVPRLGVLPRYAKAGREMRWFEVPVLNIMHTINTWEEEEGDTIVLLASNVWPVEHFIDNMDLVHTSIEKIVVDLKTGMVRRRPLVSRNLEFGVINQAYVGKKTKYVYAATTIWDVAPIFFGVVKLDISLSKDNNHDCVVASRMYEPGCYGGKPFFVAKEPDNSNAEEDYGYVICFVHDGNKGESKLLVMDAKSSNLDIMAVVKLPSRVPCGFHGLFIRESDLV